MRDHEERVDRAVLDLGQKRIFRSGANNSNKAKWNN